MFCSKCGNEIGKDDLFCGNCGHQIMIPGPESETDNSAADNLNDMDDAKDDEVPVVSDADHDTDDHDEAIGEVSEEERSDINDGDSDAGESQVEESQAEVSPVKEDVEAKETDGSKGIIYRSAYTEQTVTDKKKRLSGKRLGTLIYLAVCILIGACAGLITMNYLKANAPEKRYETYLNEGIELLSDHDYTGAEERFLTAIELDPREIAAYQQLSEAYLNMNSISDLGELFQKALDNLGEDDLGDFKTYISDDLTSVIKRSLRQDDMQYVSQYIDLLENIDKSAADSMREMMEESEGE